MKKIFTTISLVICLQWLASACTCFDTGSFCESVKFLQTIQDIETTVIHAEVIEQTGNGIKVSVLQVFYGDALIGSNYEVKDGSGLECLISTDDFEVGKTYIFAFQFPSSQPQLISICGTFFLKVENGKVKGNIAPNIDEVQLSDFPSISDCGDLNAFREPKFELNTNLTANERIWAFPDFWIKPFDVEIQVFDINGRVVFTAFEKEFMAFEPIEINVKELAAGFYFCQFNFLGKKQTIRFVKMR